MSLLDVVRDLQITRGTQFLSRYERALADAATQDFAGIKVQFYDAQVCYRLKGGNDSFYREPVIKQIPIGAVETLNHMAQFAISSVPVMTIECIPSGADAHSRTMHVLTSDVLFIQVLVTKHAPEQTDEDVRRSKFTTLEDRVDERPH